jgi:hypothetical protein
MHIPDSYTKAFSLPHQIRFTIENNSFDAIEVPPGFGRYFRKYLVSGEKVTVVSISDHGPSATLRSTLEAEPPPPDSVIYTLSGIYRDGSSWMRLPDCRLLEDFSIFTFGSLQPLVPEESFIDGVSLAKLLEWDEAERRDLSVPVPRRCWSDAQRQAVSAYRSEELRRAVKAKQLADGERERSRVQIDSADDY